MKQSLLFLVSILFIFSCTEKNKKFTVKGTVKGMGNGEVYIIPSADTPKIDTVKVVNDVFTYEGTITEPRVYMLNFGEQQKPIFFIAEGGNITAYYELNNYESGKIDGGNEQKVFNEYVALGKPILMQMDSLGKVAQENEENPAVLNVLQNAFVNLDIQLKKQQFDFISKHKNHVVNAFIGINYLSEKMDKTITDVQAVYSHLDDKVKATYYGKKINEMINQLKSTSVGSVAPNFTLNDVNGNAVSLQSFKGKITLIDFWASWCSPCRAENPHVVSAYSQFHAKGFEILGVSLDSEKEQWQAAIAKDNLTWTHVSDLKGWQSEVANLYGVQSIPSNFLLDKDGKIIAKNLRGDELISTLNELFK